MSVKKLSSRQYKYIREVRRKALKEFEEAKVKKPRKLITMAEAILKGIKIKK